jgi:hypothetical protein
MKLNRQSVFFAGTWIAFLAYAFLLAPPDKPDTAELIINLSTGNWSGINPLVIALFNLMGIWPLLFLPLLLVDGRSQKIWAWPFAIISFGVGAFALLPYLAWRQPGLPFTGEKNWLLQILDSRWFGVAIAPGVVVLLAYGLLAGDWADFATQWQHSRFIHVMSLDFCLLCLLFPVLMWDDRRHRNWQRDWRFWLFALPLIGANAYLIFHPPLLPPPDPAQTQPRQNRQTPISNSL